MELVRRLNPDVLGVRGAACEEGRTGVISSRLVRRLAAAVGRSQASFATIA
jgi:uncharacterized protein (UPF0264 family)